MWNKQGKEVKKLELGFLGSGIHAHVEGYAHRSTAYVRILWLARVCRPHMCVGLLKNPSPKRSKTKNRATLKNDKSNNLTYL